MEIAVFDDIEASPNGQKIAKIHRNEAAWRQILSPRAYSVLREGATEPPYSGELLSVEARGVYRCAGCGTALFLSDANPGTGVGERLGTTNGPGLGFELGNHAGLFMGIGVGYYFGKLRD